MKNHESALLVVLSYVIGFTTAFIMFTMSSEKYDQPDSYALDNANVTEEVSASKIELMETSEGLFVKKVGQERIISAFTDATVAEPGFHTDIVVSSISPDGQYVHYCAVMTADAEVCQSFVYSVSEDAVYMVKNADEHVESSISEVAQISWSDESTLVFGDQVANQSSRWVIR